MRGRALLAMTALTGSVLGGLHGSRPALAAPAGAGYAVTTFATGKMTGCSTPTGGNASPTCYYNPDSLTRDRAGNVYVGYQNNGAADGTAGSSIVAEYAPAGVTPIRFFGPYPGKTDGLRIDPATQNLWVLNNEDANPVLRIVARTTTSTYNLPTPTPFSGGYDDIAFTAAGTFMSVSNPALTKNGTNNYRTLVRFSFDGSGQPVINPVLPGQVVATDRATGAQVKVNITDPDSLSIDPSGDVVLNDQGDSTLLFLPGGEPGSGHVSALFLTAPSPTSCPNPSPPPATLTPCPPIVDETTWATSSTGHFLVADHAKPGNVYGVTGPFTAGEAYTTVSSDNPTPGLANTLGHLNTTTGVIRPIVSGFHGPKGLVFIP